MDTLSLVYPGIFVMMILLGAILQSFMSHVAKSFFLLGHTLDDLRAEFDAAVAASNEVADNAEDELKNQEDICLAQAKEMADVMKTVNGIKDSMNNLENRLASLKVFEANMEEMKDIVGRLHAMSVTPRDLQRAVEGCMTYPSVKELVAEACGAAVATATAEAQAKAADMIFQSEAIQRRRLELVRKTLEALTGQAEQNADFVTKADLASFVGHEELAGLAKREELAGLAKNADLGALSHDVNEKLKAVEAAAAAAAAAAAVPGSVVADPKEAEYYQGWMATAEMNGIKAEMEISNIQFRTKSENKAWLDEENKDALANRESFVSLFQRDPDGWKQGANSSEYIKRVYKAGEWSTGVKAEFKLTFPLSPPPAAGLPPPPPRDGPMCLQIFNKLTPMLTWERVLLAAETV